MAFFDPSKPIILRTEASFNEGLSAALLQKRDRGIQPVHFISRTMRETEKRYSQTEKDALALKWAKERLRIYLLGAPRFRIVTAHKPLIPLFNKVKAKVLQELRSGSWKCKTYIMSWCTNQERTKQTP